jgi:hypothetical protein
MTKNKTNIALTILLTTTIALTLIALPTVQAQGTKATYAFIGAVPNPVGVGQEVLLHVGIPDATARPQEGWTGITVTVTRPDGTKQTLGPFETDTTGGTGTVYIPTMVGTYQLQSHFPEQVATVTTQGIPAGTIFKASDSPILELTVQEEPITYYPGSPLPTEYWTRPINAQHREWSVISANWLVPTPILPNTNLFAPYNNDAPESAHILWTRPVGDTMGGLAGGPNTVHSYGIGDAYEGKWVSSVIIGGILFYNKFEAGQPQQQVVAVNLHTGQELYTKTFFDNQRISFGQVLYWDCLNYHGAFSYLWVVSGTNWYAFEPLTGEWRYNMTNVPSGTNYYGPDGEILRYTVNTANGWMTQWNTSTVVNQGKIGMAESWGSQVKGRTYNATERGYDWNVTIPTGLTGSVRTILPTDRVIGAAISTKEVTIWGLSLKLGQEGQLLFKNTWQAPSDWAAGNQTISWAAASIEEKVAVLYSKERNHYFGFSLETGQNIWGPTPSEHYLNIYDRISTINYGTLVSSGASGTTYGYNAQTGELIWTYDALDQYSEILWANNWWLQQLFIADGKVYLGHVEHSPINPLPRGAPFICLDVKTGEEIWRTDGAFRQTCWGGKAGIADSIIALMDTYDQRIYAVGKGPSQTTITAPDIGIPLGSSVVIRGTVTDISPGSEEYALRARFPNGIPATADECMSEWMKYVYMQFERPTDATGVEVTLSVLDANNNYREIGTTTSNSDGFYTFNWKPDIEGQYTVYANFAGSKSYWPSHAVTSFAVDPAPAAPAEVEIPPDNSATYAMYSTTAIIAAIAIVGAILALLMLRKR